MDLNHRRYKKFMSEDKRTEDFTQYSQQARSKGEEPVEQTPEVETKAQEKSVKRKTFSDFMSDFGKWWSQWYILVLSILAGMAAVALVACLIIFRNDIDWNGWQHVIGSLGGAALAAAIAVLFYYLINKFIGDINIIGAATVFVLTLANFLVKCFLGDTYGIIFIWICSYLIVGSIALTIYCFIDDYSDWKIANIFAIAATVACFVCGLIFSSNRSWDNWQHLIGALGGAVLAVLATYIFYSLEDNDVCSIRIPGAVTVFALALINFLVEWFVGIDYKIIFIWVNAYLILGGVALTVITFSHYSKLWGSINVLAAVSVALFLVFGLLFQLTNQWDSWQHVIGLLGGAALVAAVACVLYYLDSNAICEMEIGTVVIFAFGLVNFLVKWFIGSDYRIIFFWLCVYIIAGGIALSIYLFIRNHSNKWNYSVLAATAAAIVLFVCGSLFQMADRWNSLQYVIGALGGAAVVAIVACILYYLDKESVCEISIPGAVTIVIFAIANFIAKWFIGDDYKIIFIWVCAYLIVGGITLAIIRHREYGTKWVFAVWVVVIATVISLVCGLVFASKHYWNGWNHIIGAVGGALLAAVIIGILCYLEIESIWEIDTLGALVIFVLTIGNFLLKWMVFDGDGYRIIYIWLSVYLILGSVAFSVYCFINYSGWRTFSLFIIAFTVASLACGLLFTPDDLWAHWQHIVGALGGAAFSAVVAYVVYCLDFECVWDYQIAGTIILFLSGLANVLALIFLGEKYKIVFLWLSGFGSLIGWSLVGNTFDDGEVGWGIAQVIVTLAITGLGILQLLSAIR